MVAAAERARRRRASLGAVRERTVRAGGRLLRPSLRLGTENATFLFHAGMIRLALGDEEAAARSFAGPWPSTRTSSILHADTAERLPRAPGGRVMRLVRRLAAALVVGVVMLPPQRPLRPTRSATSRSTGTRGSCCPRRGPGRSTSSTWPRSPRSRSDRRWTPTETVRSRPGRRGWAAGRRPSCWAASRSRSTARRFASVSAPRR